MTAPDRPTQGVPCPFPPCMAQVVPVLYRTDPYDASKFATMLPIHDVEGPGSWFGRCPASQFAYPGLTERARQYLAESLAAYSKRLVERAEGREWRPVGPWQQHAESEPSAPSATGKPRPAVEPSAYFPPRPADSEGAPMGETNVSSRADLRAMIAVAVQAGAELQEAAARVTYHLEKAAAAVETMAARQQTAAAMMVAAVGSDEAGAPAEAVQAVQAFSRVGGVLIELRSGLATATDRNAGAANTARLGTLKANEYANRV